MLKNICTINMKPVIGITFGKRTQEDKLANYIRAVKAAGGTPKPIRALTDFTHIDGLLLPGGGDVDPSFYKEKKHKLTEGIEIPRDEFEIKVTQRMIKKRAPILAVCRGMQILNIALGGVLIQDINTIVKSPLAHAPVKTECDEIHQMTVKKGTFLFKILSPLLDRKNEIVINSYHHQAIKKLGKGLMVSAIAEDGIIEAVELKGNKRFCLGVQFHPERMRQTKLHSTLFRSFIESCK